ncbi:hypothetical protein [Brochothrix thermosphacta]|uniref:hypothetical protein n=1 Tax=Brochothrix thermosphacta TaxID=2756 RepID=UPI000D79CC6A|nr:hypothetical protein [Brochothrix thermosphacta]SPN75929.1 hypothetical protein BTEBP_40041 [Brochothrix thermosphacta]
MKIKTESQRNALAYNLTTHIDSMEMTPQYFTNKVGLKQNIVMKLLAGMKLSPMNYNESLNKIARFIGVSIEALSGRFTEWSVEQEWYYEAQHKIAEKISLMLDIEQQSRMQTHL